MVQSVLFVPVNLSVGLFIGTVFERYDKRLSCHLESESEVHATIEVCYVEIYQLVH